MKNSGFYDKDTSAYITTNEDLRESLRLMPKNCKNVLTVAASGDHPLFCSLHGAEHVDTFDISYNAKLIMDIKTVAIGLLNRDEYARMLENLWWRDDALTAPHMEQVSKYLPGTEYDYLCSKRGFRLFNRDAWEGRESEYLPTVSEYEKLQKIVKEPYSFTQTDIADLSVYLTDKYDFMHFSNIFDYIYEEYQWKVIMPLLNNVNVGGRVLIHCLKQSFLRGLPFSVIMPDDKKSIERVFENWRILHFPIRDDNILVFERVR